MRCLVQRLTGTCSALQGPVILYDLGVKGYHTPLTREQIAELFYSGRVDRHHPCKLTPKSEWRTIVIHEPISAAVVCAGRIRTQLVLLSRLFIFHVNKSSMSRRWG
jgi:hypothetical protein